MIPKEHPGAHAARLAADERAERRATLQNGYTTHGHPIPGMPQSPERPAAIARCGGPMICTACAADGYYARSLYGPAANIATAVGGPLDAQTVTLAPGVKNIVHHDHDGTRTQYSLATTRTGYQTLIITAQWGGPADQDPDPMGTH